MINLSSRSKSSSSTPKIGEKKKSKKGLWIFVGIFGGLVAVAWLADRARSHQETSVEKELPQAETFDSLLLSDDYSKLKSEVELLGAQYLASHQTSLFTIKADNIKKRILLIDRALEISETDEESTWSLTHKLKLSLLLESLYAFKDLKPTENFDNLLKLVESQRNHPAEDVQIEICFANMMLPILESQRDEAIEFDRKKVLADIENLIALDPDNLTLARRISGMSYFFSSKDDRKHYIACLKILEDKYTDSSVASLREIADNHRRIRILATHRLPELETLDKSSDRDQKLLEGILAIVENERLDALLVQRLLQSCSIIENRRAYALAIEGYSSIEEKLKSEQNQKTASLAKLANDGVLRCEAVGKKLPLEFTDQTGQQYEPSDFDGHPVFIAILDDQGQSNAETIELLKKLNGYRTGEGLYLILLIKNTTGNNTRHFADLVDGKMIVVGQPISESKIDQAFPTSHTPTYMFLDGEQNLIAASQKTNEVITRVNSLVHKVRKARLQSN